MFVSTGNPVFCMFASAGNPVFCMFISAGNYVFVSAGNYMFFMFISAPEKINDDAMFRNPFDEHIMKAESPFY